LERYELFIGPQHVGITGNFSLILELEGNVVKKVTPNPGFLHRGFEKLMEMRGFIHNVPIVSRICVPDPDPNEVNYAMAVERLLGVEPPPRAKYIRTIVLEFSRIASHLFTFGGHAGSIGLYTIPNWTISDRDFVLDLFEMLTGGRVYHIYVYPGGVRRDIPDGFKEKAKEFLDYLEKRLEDYDRLYFDSYIFRKRTIGIGVIKREEAIDWGVTGPNLRASGVKADTRRDDPYEAYPELEFEIPVLTGGDAHDRMMIRRMEVSESIKIIRQALDNMPDGPIREKVPNPMRFIVPPGDVYVRVESSKGEYGYYMVSNGKDKPYRVYIRGASMTHGIHVIEKILLNSYLADVSQVLFSLDVCPPEIDR